MSDVGAHGDGITADVLIVGMGPTGVVLAGLLGQQGITTAVYDRLPGLYPLPRAAGMDQEVMRIAQELGVAEALAPFVRPYRASQYRGVDGQVIKRLDSPPPPHRLGWEPLYAFDQPQFENVLRTRVSELPSVRIELECSVTRIGQDPDGVWAEIRGETDDEARVVTGRYLVGCDGGASFVRRSLGIPLTDLGFHENFLVVDAIVEPDALERLPQTQVQFCEPARPCTFVALAGHHRRWEIMLDPGELPTGAITDDVVWPYLRRWIRPGDATIWRSAAYRFHGLVADRWRDGRILIAGDAAHMTPPFMAQGMAQGMRDAQNLAWKLACAIDEPSNDGVLESYEAERRPHVVATTKHTIDLGRVICERDETLARERDALLRGTAATDDEVPVTFRSTFLPALTAGLVTATPGAGQVSPQPVVDGPSGTMLLDDAAGRGFRLLVDATATDADVAELRRLLTPLDGRVVMVLPPTAETSTHSSTFRDVEGVLTGWLTELGAHAVAVRPDHYVYGTAEDPASTRGLVEQLVAAVTAHARTTTGV